MKDERRKKMARASRFMIRYRISLIALHGLLIKPPPPSRLGFAYGEAYRGEGTEKIRINTGN